MHIAPYDNQNKPIVDVDNACVPLNYFNIVKLKKGEAFEYQVPGYETCIVPATGTRRCQCGRRWPSPSSADAASMSGTASRRASMCRSARRLTIVCVSDQTETFIAGAKYDKVLEPFAVRADELDLVQYGSDDTKTHRKIKHILGQKQHDKVGRLLVSELFTVGQGGWSGFPSHKHDTDRLPDETRHDETYNFRFRPIMAPACRCCSARTTSRATPTTSSTAPRSASTRATTPAACCRATRCIISPSSAGSAQRSLIQYFQPTHAYQLDTIPGIMDMVAKFK
jgi:5-deoxy-glucuronate isomerase